MSTTFEITYNCETGKWGYSVFDENDEWLDGDEGFDTYEQAVRFAEKHYNWIGV